MRAVATTLLSALALGFAAAPSIAATDTKLPVGDSKFSPTTPKRGYVYSCQSSYNGGGAFRQGPWFNGDGTYDYTKKAIVDGHVTWPEAHVSFTLNGTSMTISGNDLPVGGFTGTFPVASDDDAAQYDPNPNSIMAQTVNLSVPANPKVASKPSCIFGYVGYALNGVAVADGLDAGGRDAAAWEVQDACQGHPNPSGYHYHTISRCLTSYKAGRSHSKLVGYAFDGFGIFGPRGTNGKIVTNKDLDACHGHVHRIKFHGKTVRMYHYHATREYPYTVGCFRGASNEPRPTGPPPGRS